MEIELDRWLIFPLIHYFAGFALSCWIRSTQCSTLAQTPAESTKLCSLWGTASPNLNCWISLKLPKMKPFKWCKSVRRGSLCTFPQTTGSSRLIWPCAIEDTIIASDVWRILTVDGTRTLAPVSRTRHLQDTCR